jgi:hypothetical protein
MTKDVRKWKLKDLRPHPRQAGLFPDLPFHLLRDLAQDIGDRGRARDTVSRVTCPGARFRVQLASGIRAATALARISSDRPFLVLNMATGS